MSGRGVLTTSILIEDELGETEYDVRVLYDRAPGFRGTYYQPAEPSSVEIIEITPKDQSIAVPEHFYTDDGLLAECMADWAEEIEDAAEWRAQDRRDRLLMDKWEASHD